MVGFSSKNPALRADYFQAGMSVFLTLAESVGRFLRKTNVLLFSDFC